MKGSTFKRCGCREALPDGQRGEGKLLGDKCPALAKSSHGTWFYRADVGPDPLTGRRREQRKGGFRTAKEAQSALAQVIAAVSTGNHRHDERLTVGDWLTTWLDRRVENGLRPSTALQYRAYVNSVLIPHLGRVRLGDLRPEDVERMVSDLRKAGKGAVTIQRVHAVLRAALTGARKSRLVAFNAASEVQVPKASTAKPKPWTPSELAAFMKVAGEHRLGSLYEFMARTGLRRGEALGLCHDDVDSAAGYLVVRTALVQVGSRVVEGDTKTEAGASRRVALASDTLGLLLSQRLAQEADQVRWGSAYRNCGHGGRVFAREDGSDLTPEQVTKTFARLVKDAGVRPQRLHDLRHLSASFDALAGVPINVTSKRLGHSNPAFTMRVYQHLYAETATEAAEAAAAFFPARSAAVGGRDAPTLRPRDLRISSEPPPGNTEQGADLRKHQSRRGDSNPQPPVYKDYGSRPSRSGKVQPVLNCLTRQFESPMAIRLGPGPLLADPLANGLLCRTGRPGRACLRVLRVKVSRHPA
jgi:integrase